MAALDGVKDADKIQRAIAAKLEQMLKDLETRAQPAKGTSTFQIPGDGITPAQRRGSVKRLLRSALSACR